MKKKSQKKLAREFMDQHQANIKSMLGGPWLTTVSEQIKSLDGAAAYNKEEPSPGDLERLAKHNAELRAEIAKLKQSNEILTKGLEHYACSYSQIILTGPELARNALDKSKEIK